VRILIARNDRLGDLVLSTPVISSIRASYKNAYIGVLVNKYAKDVIRYNNEIDTIIIDEDMESGKLRGFSNIVKVIKREHFDIALILHPTFTVCALAFFSGIKRRISHGSKWYVYLFCNEVLKQNRSRVPHHEADFNLELAGVIGGMNNVIRRTKILFPESSIKRTREFLAERSINGNDAFAIMHCGSGGSARNWAAGNYAELADLLIRELSLKLLLTGTQVDKKMVTDVQSAMKEKPVEALNIGSVSDYAALISNARVFVGPSTGPLHFAVAMNIPVAGIYSPVFVQSATRWGPYSAEKSFVICPDVVCPAIYRCIYEKCKFYDCMALIRPYDVFKKVSALLVGSL